MQAFEADLARLGRRAPLARALLVALAWAEGPGLPWDDIWLTLARTLTAGDGPGQRRRPGHRHVRWLLWASGAHLVTDTGPGGQAVSRLRDAAVAAHLRGEPRRDGPRAGEAAARPGRPAQDAGWPAEDTGWPAQRTGWPAQRAGTQRRIVTALLGTVPRGEHGPDWAAAHPYLRAYLARHAAAAGPDAFAGLVADTGFLAVADPVTLVPLLSMAPAGLRGITRGYRRARPLLGADPRTNAAQLQEAARALEVASLRGESAVCPRYRTRMASVRRDESLLTLAGHTAMVYGVAFGTTRDGRLLLASGSDDGTIRIWDPYTGTETVDPITGHGDEATGPGVAPWGQTMKPSETYWTTGKEVQSVAFGTTSDGRLLLASAGCDRTVRVWDPLTGGPVGDPLTGHTGRIWNVESGRAPGGRLLFATGGDDMTVRVWDAQALRPLGVPLTGHTDQVVTVAIGTMENGSCLVASASSDCTVRLWDPLTGSPVGAPITGHDAPVFGVRFGTAPDGRVLLATGGEDMTIKLWDPVTGSPVGRPLTGHTDRVDGLAFAVTGDGRWLLISSSRDQTLRLWDPLTGSPVGRPLCGHTSWVFWLAAATTPDGLLMVASSSADTTIRIWDALAAAAPPEPASGHTRWVTSAAFGTAPDGRLLLAAGSGDGTVGVWNPVTGRPAGDTFLLTDPRPPGGASAGGGPARGGSAGAGRSPGPGSPGPGGNPGPGGGPRPGGLREVPSVAFGTAPGGRLLLAAGSGDGTVAVWDALTHAPVGEPVQAHQGAVRSLAFGTTRDGRLLLATGGTDKTARLWNPLTGRPAGEPLTGHEGWVDALAFGTAPAGELLLATGGDDATIRLWDPLTGRPIAAPITSPAVPGGAGGVRALAIATSHRGRPLLAAGGDDATIRLWDPLTGRAAAAPLTGHTGWVAALAFTTTRGGRLLLVSGGGDRTVRLWRPARTRPVASPRLWCPAPTRPVACLERGTAVRAVAATGLTLAVGDDNGVTVLELAEEDLGQLLP